MIASMTSAPTAVDRSPALPRPIVRGLRREAFRLLRSDSRRLTFPHVLRVGRLDRWPAEHHSCAVPRVPNAGLALDVAEALLLERSTPHDPHVWLTRPGPPEADHLDHAWQRALHDVAEAHGLRRPRLLIVTRTGWQGVDCGEGQRWSRLRLVLPDS